MNDKTAQYLLASKAGIPIIPYAVVAAGSGAPALKDAAAALDAQLQDSDLKGFCEGYALKPSVGECKKGFLSVKTVGKNDADKVRRHMGQHPDVTCWLVQPFFPQFCATEYKVYLSGDAAMVVYLYFTPDGSSGHVFCPDGHIFSEYCNHDGTRVETLGASDAVDTWENRRLYDKLVQFAKDVRAKFSSRLAERRCVADCFLRVDVVLLFPKLAAEERYDVANPLILLNELDLLGGASLMVDCVHPSRDTLATIEGFPGRATQHGRQAFHATMIDKLKALLRDKLVSA